MEAEGLTQYIPEYLLPFMAVLALGWVIVKSLYDQATSKATAAIEVTPEILEGVRGDLERATERADAAAREGRAARERAEAAERAHDTERELRRKVEDDFHDYRVNARLWTQGLLSQLAATGEIPVEAPEGFDI